MKVFLGVLGKRNEVDEHEWMGVVDCLMRGNGMRASLLWGLGGKEYISYLISKIVNPYQSLYIIRVCHSEICHWKIQVFE